MKHERKLLCRSPKYFFFEIFPFGDSAYGLTGRHDFLITLSPYPNFMLSLLVNEAQLCFDVRCGVGIFRR